MAIAAVAAALGVTSIALAAPVPVPNGGFEKDSFAKWNRFERGGGAWRIFPFPFAPPRGIGGGPIPDPPKGKHAAVLTQGSPGLNILHRVIRLKPDAVNRIRFQLYYDNSNEEFHSPKHFRFGGGGALPRGGPVEDPNQQLRVDLMKPKAKIKSLRDRHILATLLWTRPGDPLQRPYRTYRANMEKLGIDGKKVRLRIAEVDNSGEFFVGVDVLKHRARDLD